MPRFSSFESHEMMKMWNRKKRPIHQTHLLWYTSIFFFIPSFVAHFVGLLCFHLNAAQIEKCECEHVKERTKASCMWWTDDWTIERHTDTHKYFWKTYANKMSFVCEWFGRWCCGRCCLLTDYIDTNCMQFIAHFQRNSLQCTVCAVCFSAKFNSQMPNRSIINNEFHQSHTLSLVAFESYFWWQKKEVFVLFASFFFSLSLSTQKQKWQIIRSKKINRKTRRSSVVFFTRLHCLSTDLYSIQKCHCSFVLNAEIVLSFKIKKKKRLLIHCSLSWWNRC